MPNRFEHLDGETTGRASSNATAKPRVGWGAWRTASLASLALAGCVVMNVAAGCGGGGGGATVVPTPTLASATILLLNPSGLGVNGTVTLNGVTRTTTNSRAVFTNLRAGTYPLTFTVAGVPTRTNIAVAASGSQTFVAVPGQSDVSSNGIRISGRTLLNTPANSATAACNSDSQPVTAALVIQVRDLNLVGRPIVSSIVRAANTDGRYIVFTVPRASTYRVEARSLDSSAAPFTGQSASFTINAGQTQQNLDICTNQSATAPGGTPPPPPGTPTPGPGTPTVTPNGTATVGGTAVATATTDPNATATPTTDPNATATATGGAGGGTATPTGNNGVPTSTPQATPTNTVAPTATATPGAGTPTSAPTATPTAVGGQTPPTSPNGSRRGR